MEGTYYITTCRQFGSGGREVGKRVAQALGIPYYDKELLAVGENGEGLAEALEEVKLRSRQYAKRQLTWLRRNGDIHWITWGKERDFARALQVSTEILTAAGVC